MNRYQLILQEIAFAAAAMAQSENWRGGLDELLARLGRAVAVSRVFLFEIDPTPEGVLAHTCRHDWCAPGLARLGGSARYTREILVDYDPVFDGWIERRRRGELISGHTRELPPGPLRDDFEFQEIKSFLSAPIHLNGDWWGNLGFDDCVKEREWAAEEIHLLQTTAALIAASAMRERAARSLRELEALRGAMMDVALDCILLTDTDGMVLELNPAFEAAFGWSRSQVLRRRLGAFLFTPEQQRALGERLARAQRVGARGPALRTETSARCADGRVVPVELTMARIAREARTVDALFMRDLTERKATEKRLGELAHERANLARFFPRNLVEHLIDIDAPLAMARLQDAAVMFVDMVGFTSLCLRRSPDEVVAILRDLFGIASDIVFRHQGTVFKFTGDGLMAVFGAPMRGVADASRAVSCALEFQSQWQAWNARQSGDDGDIRIAVGVHYGEVLFGDVGSESQLELTVLGDVVNIASRVEGYCRSLGASILITGATWDRVNEERRPELLAGFAACGRHVLRGQQEAIPLFGTFSGAAPMAAAGRLPASEIQLADRRQAAWPAAQPPAPARRAARPSRLS